MVRVRGHEEVRWVLNAKRKAGGGGHRMSVVGVGKGRRAELDGVGSGLGMEMEMEWAWAWGQHVNALGPQAATVLGGRLHLRLRRGGSVWPLCMGGTVFFVRALLYTLSLIWSCTVLF